MISSPSATALVLLTVIHRLPVAGVRCARPNCVRKAVARWEGLAKPASSALPSAARGDSAGKAFGID
jgi:hypothetical protein